MNAIDILLIVILAFAVILALRRVHKMRRSGCSCCSEGDPGGCTGSCASCGASCSRKEKP